MNYYPHHIGDFRSGTINMSRVERWIYRDLLDVYYDTERPLPLDLDQVCYDVGVSSDDERRLVGNLLRFKFTKTDCGYVHERCQAEIEAYRARQETAQENGKKGATPRHAKSAGTQVEGFLYAARLSERTVKIGTSSNLKSRLHQLRSKHGRHVVLLHSVKVASVCDAECDLLAGYDATESGEISIATGEDIALRSRMDRIAVAYPVAYESHTQSHTGSHTNQEPITNNQEVNGSGTSIAVSGDDAIRRLPDAYVPANPAEWATFFGAEYGIEVSVSSQHDRRKFVPLATAWVNAGITLGRMRHAIERAYAEATEPIAYLPAYVDRVLASSSAPRASPRSAENAAILAGLAGNPLGDEHGNDPGTIDVDATVVG